MEVLELNPRQGIFDCLVPTLIQVPTKADSITKERSCKRGAVGARGAGRMYRSDLPLLVGLRVWDDWLELEGTNPCRTCHRPKVRNPRACLGHCTRQSVVGFCEGEEPLLRSLETF